MRLEELIEYIRTGKNFNPRIPRGMRLKCGKSGIAGRVFQSTHPAGPRGMRQFPDRAFDAKQIISIHASRGGCDDFLVDTVDMRPKFQSTHPAGDATERLYNSSH